MRSFASIWASLSRALRGQRGSNRGPHDHPVRWVEPPELLKRIGAGAIVVDVRGPDEYAGPLGHIPRAINLPLPALQGRLHELAPFTTKPLILVCHTDKRSAAAASLLSAHGFHDVSVLRGGMARWRADSLAAESGATG